jgi:hypothetical protein
VAAQQPHIQAVPVKTEDSDEHVDAVTAINWSDPYVFRLIESLQVARLGFSENQGRGLVARAVAGSLKQARDNETPFVALLGRGNRREKPRKPAWEYSQSDTSST